MFKVSSFHQFRVQTISLGRPQLDPILYTPSLPTASTLTSELAFTKTGKEEKWQKEIYAENGLALSRTECSIVP